MSTHIDSLDNDANAIEASKILEDTRNKAGTSQGGESESGLSDHTDSEDEIGVPKTIDGFVDYNQIYEQLQEKYNQVFAVSQKLFLTEKSQRQTLYHYKRRLNALSDVLQDIELAEKGEETVNIDEPMQVDGNRLSALVTWRPELARSLGPVLQIAEGKSLSSIPVKRSLGITLAVEEQIPEIINDELDIVELNPQETDMWARRNYNHLVVSKFKPADIKARGVKEYGDASANGPKRKKRS